ncbi:LysM peptidoglycan-binding domain-containing protein [Bacillus norwichensis]|uniref:LysM peptidoglycan-binding domain-containing protein n=1 Tax=Bacillus norwichensis TaxID=2762217 RepID=A0ABR8VMY3_9BACI|nr:LysM peptidoglycan-binding domain-containing protein [Bacillus norwichensis]MBD8005811.1 LysM peptidoglycan-binding domain-containing protein [Bacillus norwichensis]
MGIIMDISHHQKSSAINWVKAAKEVDMVIIRVQYGSNLIDREYKNHVANCKKHGIPFGHYAYGMYVSVNDAIVEANDFIKRADKDALFLALDVEGDTVKSCGTKNLSKASQAFIDTLKNAGYKTGYYVSHELYKKYGLDEVKADFLWLPRYGKDNGKPHLKPNYACDLWQYSQHCKVSWYNGGLDFNLINGNKPLSWFIGKTTVSVNKPAASKPTPNKKPATNTHIVKAGDTLSAIAKKYKTTVAELVKINGIKDPDVIRVGQTIKLSGSAPAAPAQKAVYHTVKHGDTVSALALKNKVTQAQIKSWNNLKDVNKINVGQRLRVK